MRDPGQVAVPRGARQRPAVIADTGWGRRSRALHPPPGKVRASSRGSRPCAARVVAPGSSRFVSQGGRRSRGRGSHGAADGVILPARMRDSLCLLRETPADAASFNVAPGRRFARFAIKPEPSREPLVCKSVAFSRPASDAAISVFMGGRARHRTAAPTAPEEERPTGAQPRPPIRLRQAAKGMIDTVPARAMTCRCRAGG